MDTKLVCWTGIDGKDYEFEVSEKAKWIAWDGDVALFWYARKPDRHFSGDVWLDHGGRCNHIAYGIAPPEKGHWYDQLYWIGDE